VFDILLSRFGTGALFFTAALGVAAFTVLTLIRVPARTA
jgi:hypothetical protein